MMRAILPRFARLLVAAWILAGVVSPLTAQIITLPPPDAPAPAVAPAQPCDRCGTVAGVRQVTTKDTWTPLGSVSSGGHGTSDLAPMAVTQYQVGRDGSKQGTVLLGAAGGATYQSRPSALNAKRWELTVRMDDGSVRALMQNYEPMMRSGDRVRVLGTQVELL